MSSFAKLGSPDLVARFADSARAQWKAIEAGNSTAANREFRTYTNIVVELRRRGPESVQLFLGLLQSADPAVRMAAASYALELSPIDAEAVLEEVSTQPRTLGLNARTLLKEWRAGRIEPTTLRRRRQPDVRSDFG